MTNVKDILKKAKYCESCATKPCQVGCPLNNDITEFIKFVKQEKFEEAYKVLSETTVLMSLCGRICPHEKQCQGVCVKGISYEPVQIGDLEAYVGDIALKNNYPLNSPKTFKHHVAVVGGGPAGLTCAAFLRRNGIGVTIYEKHDYLGGLLVHGIPEFRLSKTLVKKVIDRILDLGINVKYKKYLSKNITLKQLENEYDAVFLGIGANISSKMNIEGENLSGVYGGNELLENNIKLDYKDKIVIVSGGGNTAMDISRSIKRLGAKKVIVVYRRSIDEMPAEKKEIKEAQEEGIKFLFQTNILKIIGEDKVKTIEVIKTELVKKEESRPSPVNIEGTNYKIPCDYVIMAVGSHPEEFIDNLDLELSPKGNIKIDKFGHTSNEKVFSGGDLAGTKATVAWAARAGRNAAYGIIKYLKENNL